VTFETALRRVMAAGDLEGAVELLDSLTGADGREARQWFAGHTSWLSTMTDELEYLGADHDERFVNRQESYWIAALCALALCGPATAARRVPWRHLWSYREERGEAVFVHRLWEADRDWAATFVTAAAELRLSRADASNANHTLSRVLRATVVHHGLLCPTGDAFVAGWLAGTSAYDGHTWGMKDLPALDAWLARDPLMPDILLLRLSSGLCGRDRWLPRHVRTAVDVGLVQRNAIISTTLEALTRPQRAATEVVLADILAQLDLEPAELPGGLDFALGVLSTTKGAVGKVLLPRAIDLVESPAGLRDLVGLIASRPEKAQKSTLLKALVSRPLLDRVGSDAVREALEVLVSDDDAAFSDRVARALAALPGGGEASPGSPAAEPIGLWDLEPTPSDLDYHALLGYDYAFPWRAVIGRYPVAVRDVDRGWTVQTSLEALRRDPGAWQERAWKELALLLASGALLPSRAALFFGEIFLAGGLRSAYPVVLRLAGECVERARVPAGTPDLIRLLAQYAGEIPSERRPPLPTSIATTAAAQGSTKTQMEARRLATLLAPAPVTGAGMPAGAGDGAPPPRGLWRELTRTAPVFGERRITGPFAEARKAPDALARIVAITSGQYSGPFVGACALDEVVEAVLARGADAVRPQVARDVSAWDRSPHVAAIALWASGVLDAGGYWRIVEDSVPAATVLGQVPGDIPQDETIRRMRAVPSLATQLAPGFDPRSVADLPELAAHLGSGSTPSRHQVVAPPGLETGPENLLFRHALECLLLAEQGTPVLATPVWQDGTVDLATLIARLGRVAQRRGTVGPIDLVLALHRLRHEGPVPRAELDALGAVPTDPALTSPSGEATEDAVGLLRTWLGAGGLPPIDATAVDGFWTTSATTPVPFARCRAVPAEVAADPFHVGSAWLQTELMPLWPDRRLQRAFGEALPRRRSSDFPLGLSGELGLAMHDSYLSHLTHFHHDSDLGSGMQAMRQPIENGKLRTPMLVRAALGRHQAGTLRLTHLASSWEVLCERGHLSGLWEPMLAVADALAAEPRRPTDLHALLRLLNRYAVEGPTPGPAPEHLRALATARGSTKAHVEARLLVTALDLRAGGPQ
jgi:hypothetical protein